MGPENRFNPTTHLENRLRPQHAPDIREYTIFDFRQVGSKEKHPFVNLLPGKVVYWPHHSSVIKNGDKVPLRPKEQALLDLFVNQPNSVISKQELSRGVWGENFNVARLPTLINHLRRRIEPNPEEPVIIQRVKGEGYRFDESREAKTDRQIYLAENIVYRPDQKLVRNHGKEKILIPPEKELLDMLMEANYETVLAQDIYYRAWPGERFSLPRLSSLIKNLRGKVEHDPKAPSIILRVRGKGYKLADFDPAKNKYLELASGFLKYSTGNRMIETVDHNIGLTEREYELFLTLCENPGAIHSLEALKERVFTKTTKDQVINNYIGRIRKKLGKTVIETKPKEGFRLNVAA